MVDVRVLCTKCSAQNIFSEYAEKSVIVCRECGSSLEGLAPMPDRRVSEGLAPIPDRRVSKSALNFKTPPLHSSSPAQDVPVASRGTSSTDLRKTRGSRRWVGVLVFLVLATILVGAQWKLSVYSDIEPLYMPGRYAVVGLVFFMILMEAFRDGTTVGILCLLLPFYIIYYAITRIESYWRQGVFLAVVVMLGAEMYFLPEQSMLSHLREWATVQVERVGQSIHRAGDAPIE